MGQPRYIKRKLFWLLLGIVCVVYFKYVYSILCTYTVDDDGLAWKTTHEREMHFFVDQHGDYFVLHNVKRAVRWFFNNDSITLTTHGTYMDLHHLPELVLRWNGPISIALYTNGPDLQATIWTITYMLHCTRNNILLHELVTFHFCIEHQHLPENLTQLQVLLNFAFVNNFNCAAKPPAFSGNASQTATYWYQQNLNYPYNKLRNIARASANTYYAMALHLGWYPIMNSVPRFLRLMKTQRLDQPYASIFCFPRLIAINNTVRLPYTQLELYSELRKHLLTYGKDNVERRISIIARMTGQMRVELVDNDFAGCNSEFIMVNSKLPFFDERLYSDTRLVNLLFQMSYQFVHMAGSVLIKNSEDIFYTKPNELRRTELGKVPKKPSKDVRTLMERVSFTWMQLYDY